MILNYDVSPETYNLVSLKFLAHSEDSHTELVEAFLTTQKLDHSDPDCFL